MYVEIQEAISFIAQFLYDRIPRRRVDQFAVHFANHLFHKYSDHWSEANPGADVDYRRIDINARGYTDKLLLLAADQVMLDLKELLAYLPTETVVFVDPGKVSARKGETSTPDVVYPALDELRRRQPGLRGPKLRVKCVLDSSVDDKYTCEVFELEDGGQNYTAGAFAQTRFGSMKVKSHMTSASGSSASSSRSMMQSSRPQPLVVGAQSSFVHSSAPAIFAPVVSSYYVQPRATHSPMSLTYASPPSISAYYGSYANLPNYQQPPVDLVN